MPASRYRRNMTTEPSGPSATVRSGLAWHQARDLTNQWNIEAEGEGQDYRYRAMPDRDGDHAVQRYTPAPARVRVSA